MQQADNPTPRLSVPSADNRWKTRNILGFEILVASHDEAIVAMDDYLDAKSPALITFLNAHVSNLAAKDEHLAGILRQSLILNDGIGVDIASRLLHGAHFPDNLNGTDMIPRFLRHTRHRFRIYMVGSAAGVADRALKALQDVAPQHTYVGAHHGFLNEGGSGELLEDIRSKSADLVLVGMGTPIQEAWAYDLLVKPAAVSAICVGGLLDFVSEEKVRAPQWLRSLRAEWIFRLMIEPQRLWRRYLLGNPLFITRVLAARVGLSRAQEDRISRR